MLILNLKLKLTHDCVSCRYKHQNTYLAVQSGIVASTVELSLWLILISSKTIQNFLPFCRTRTIGPSMSNCENSPLNYKNCLYSIPIFPL